MWIDVGGAGLTLMKDNQELAILLNDERIYGVARDSTGAETTSGVFVRGTQILT